VAALAAMGAGAAPVVEITSVQQQYPWTNTVDITYTSTGIAEANTYYVVFKAYDAASKEIGVITNDLKVSQGSTWVAQWQPPFNVRYENCTMVPYVYKGGQDDYMIVDLETWAVTFEPMSTQDASNKKYNDNDTGNIYKTKKLVLRKIEKGDYYIGGPETGAFSNSGAANSYHKVTIPADYYIGIFELTEAQYGKIMSNSSYTSTLPVGNIPWNTIRGSAGVASRPGAGCLKNLNDKTTLGGTKFITSSSALAGFDLPTESMWEIAARAGVATKWPTGDTSSGLGNYGWIATNSGSTRHTPGLKTPNAYGLYDTVGGQAEIMRDVDNTADLAGLQSANGLQPVSSGNANYRVTRSGSYVDKDNMARYAWRWHDAPNGSVMQLGLRIACIPSL
ncbi:MAG: SUMF1/EgtB/PvdO family nonheme iron enzyme, partial [Kiritimatiellae bacterium]|nr:SUMF1/EgtB/PvdO family nonheme iron enzyme [Kiritimatiellia bacterium]